MTRPTHPIHSRHAATIKLFRVHGNGFDSQQRLLYGGRLFDVSLWNGWTRRKLLVSRRSMARRSRDLVDRRRLDVDPVHPTALAASVPQARMFLVTSLGRRAAAVRLTAT